MLSYAFLDLLWNKRKLNPQFYIAVLFNRIDSFKNSCMKNVLEKLLDRLEFGEVQTYKNLTVLPLFDGPDGEPAYLSLREGLEQQQVEITEVSEGGSVPNLKVNNRAERPVILVDGEELIGAKQNRIVNTTVLLAAQSETVIPVSCTEQGRWSYTSRQFGNSEEFMASKARYSKSRRVAASLKARATYDAIQSEVWKDVDTLHAKSGTSSRTRAMKDAYIQRSKDMEDYVKAFPLLDRQKGVIVFLNGTVLGGDYISRHSAYQSLHEKLIRSHAIEALAESKDTPSGVDVKIKGHSFLKEMLAAPEVTQHKAVGLGEDYRYEGENSCGAVLFYQDTPVHLTAFNPKSLDQLPGRHRQEWSLSNRMRRRFKK